MALGDPYVSAAELKTYLNIGDAVDDVRITSAVNSASRWIEAYCRRQFNVAGSVSARQFHSQDFYRLNLDDFSSASGLVVKTGQIGAFDETLTINTDFVIEPLNQTSSLTELPDAAATPLAYWRIRSLGGIIFPTPRWPGTDPNIEVTATWGWSAVPTPIVEACQIQASRLFKRKESPEGVLGGFQDYGPVRVGHKIDPDVKALLAPFRKHKRGWF